MEWRTEEFTISDRSEDLDLDAIHGVLRTSYWAVGIPREVVARSVEHSLCLGLYRQGQQVGFGRAITDRATFAYLSDVYVMEGWRGRGLGKWLIRCFLEHPDLQGLRRWMLATQDAHALYQQVGFQPLRVPEWFMEVHDPAAYEKNV